eukprot:TRINITY_DN16001_c0_g1_i1.p1 TRINITY_DN16001_c0_g1~~TRINITY_DN16001_c0_g1_i1.p1  ORF type:complete len:509 (+),score=126.51 TRINITY_DN16001_c0_g1_i1:87-1613(+)
MSVKLHLFLLGILTLSFIPLFVMGVTCPIMIRNVTIINPTDIDSPYLYNYDVLFLRQTNVSAPGPILKLSSSYYPNSTTLIPQTDPNVQEINGTNKFLIPSLIDSSSTIWSSLSSSPNNITLLQSILTGISSVVDTSPVTNPISFSNHRSIRTGPLIVPATLAKEFPSSYSSLFNQSIIYTVAANSTTISDNINSFNSILIFLSPLYSYSNSETTFLQNLIQNQKRLNPNFKVFAKSVSVLDVLRYTITYSIDVVLGIPSDITLISPDSNSNVTIPSNPTNVLPAFVSNLAVNPPTSSIDYSFLHHDLNVTILYGGRTGDISNFNTFGINVLELSLLNSSIFQSSIRTLTSALAIPFTLFNFYSSNSTIFDYGNLILMNNDPLLRFGALVDEGNRYWQSGVEVHCESRAGGCPVCLEEATIYYQEAASKVEFGLSIALPIFFVSLVFAAIFLAVFYHYACRRRRNRRENLDDPFAEDEGGVEEEEDEDEENLMDHEEESDGEDDSDSE